MTWLGPNFNTTDMTITIPQEKLEDIATLVREWLGYSQTNLHALTFLLSKLFHISQCCVPVRFFLNRMLETLRAYPQMENTALSPEFKGDLHWFAEYLPSTNGVYILHANDRNTVHVFIDACSMGAGVVAGSEAYYAEVPPT